MTHSNGLLTNRGETSFGGGGGDQSAQIGEMHNLEQSKDY